MNKRFTLSVDNFQLNEADISHVNKMPFSGTVAFCDTPSDGSPCGAMGKKVVFARAAVDKALSTFVGMGVNCVWDQEYYKDAEDTLTGHDDRFKIGIVESAELEGNEVKVHGFLWKYDFSDVCQMIQNTKASLGFSVEVVANKVSEAEDDKLIVTDLIFTGLAILYADLGAFKQTKLVAKDSKKSEDDLMNEEMVKVLLAEMQSGFDAKFAEMDTKLTESTAKVEELTLSLTVATEQAEALQTQVESVDAVKADAEAIKAENAELKVKVESIGLELSEVKAKKVDKIERRTASFNTIAKYGEDKTIDVLCKEISEDETLTTSQKWQLKLEAWKKNKTE